MLMLDLIYDGSLWWTFGCSYHMRELVSFSIRGSTLCVNCPSVTIFLNILGWSTAYIIIYDTQWTQKRPSTIAISTFAPCQVNKTQLSTWLSNVVTRHIPPIHLSNHPTLTQTHSLFQLHLTFGRDYIPPFGKTSKPLNSWTFEIFVMV